MTFQSSSLLQRVTPPSAAHSDCLLCSGWLHSSAVAVLSGHPMGLASPKFWGLLVQLGCTFTNNLSCALFRDSNPAVYHQASPNCHSSFMLLKPALPRGPIYCQVQLPAQSTTLAMSGTQLLYADSQETLSRRFHLNDGLFLVTMNVSTLADQHRLAQQREGFTLVVLVSCQPQLITWLQLTRTI